MYAHVVHTNMGSRGSHPQLVLCTLVPRIIYLATEELLNKIIWFCENVPFLQNKIVVSDIHPKPMISEMINY